LGAFFLPPLFLAAFVLPPAEFSTAMDSPAALRILHIDMDMEERKRGRQKMSLHETISRQM